MRTSPGPAGGSGRSCTCRTSGPPFPVCTTAFTGPAYPTGCRASSPPERCLEIDRTTDRESVELEDLGDRLDAHVRVCGQRHHGALAVLLGADRGGDDVHALL